MPIENFECNARRRPQQNTKKIFWEDFFYGMSFGLLTGTILFLAVTLS